MPDVTQFNMDFRPKSYWSKSDTKNEEVTIACVYLNSVLGWSISVRAKISRGKIRYRIADEYLYEGIYKINIKSSEAPLTFRELIDLMDTAHHPDAEEGDFGLVMSHVTFQYHEGSSDIHEAMDFAEVGSTFYPQLKGWYECVKDEWARPILERQKIELYESEKEAEIEKMHYEQEQEAIRLAPPRSPWDFSAETNIGELTPLERSQLDKWIKTLDQIQPASVRWVPRRYLCPTGRLNICWTEQGIVKEVFMDKPYPTVHDAFYALPFIKL